MEVRVKAPIRVCGRLPLYQMPCLFDSDAFEVSVSRRKALLTGRCEINVGRNEVRQKFCMNIKMTFVATESS